MKKITVKNLIKFRGKNERTKVTYVSNLVKDKKDSNSTSGGDYWISSLSAIRNTFRDDEIGLLDEKIDLLNNKLMLIIQKELKTNSEEILIY